jgi:hypothetical protein
MLSLRTGRREQELGNPMGGFLLGGWEVFVETVPPDVAEPVLALVDDPTPLADELRACDQTLIHGDVRLTNLGFLEDQVVLIDWGERTGPAPAAVELASFIGFDGSRFDITRHEVIDEFREASGEAFDERALQLALLGGMVQLGCTFTLNIAMAGDAEAKQSAQDELAWWTATTRTALRTWSPG